MPSALRKKVWERLALGPDPCLHELRARYITWLAHRKAISKAVATTAGHAAVEVTRDLYQALTAETYQEVAQGPGRPRPARRAAAGLLTGMATGTGAENPPGGGDTQSGNLRHDAIVNGQWIQVLAFSASQSRAGAGPCGFKSHRRHQPGAGRAGHGCFPEGLPQPLWRPGRTLRAGATSGDRSPGHWCAGWPTPRRFPRCGPLADGSPGKRDRGAFPEGREWSVPSAPGGVAVGRDRSRSGCAAPPDDG